MKTTRRSFFKFLGGGAVVVALAPVVAPAILAEAPIIIKKVPIVTPYFSPHYLLTPEVYANAFLAELKSKLVIGGLYGEDT